MSTKLQHCPFCNEQNYIGFSIQDGQTPKGYVACAMCGGTGPTVKLEHINDTDWYDKAAKLWNRRYGSHEGVTS